MTAVLSKPNLSWLLTATEDPQSTIRCIFDHGPPADLESFIRTAVYTHLHAGTFAGIMLARSKSSSAGEEQKVSDLEFMLRNTFKSWDLDGDGFIGPSDFQQAMAKMGEEYDDGDSRTMIDEYDEDQDGRLSFDEFAKMMSPTDDC